MLNARSAAADTRVTDEGDVILEKRSMTMICSTAPIPSLNKFLWFTCTSILLAAVSGGAGGAEAQEVPKGSTDTQASTELNPRLKPAVRRFESPERFILELRGGLYSPSQLKGYDKFFAGDKGPNLNAQLDGIVYRMPRTFYVTVGGSIGLLDFSGNAVEKADGVTPTSEQTTLSVVPLMASASVRLDVLPRRLGIPLILAARLGWEWAHWDTNTGARNNASGWSLGPVISAQVALDLDSFEPGGARALDEEWGINHTYLFGEIFHFESVHKSLELGTTSWLLGLGFIF